MKIVTKKFSKTLENLLPNLAIVCWEKNKIFKPSFHFQHVTYGLSKVHKSKITQEAIQAQNSEYIKIYEPSDLTLQPIVSGPNCPTRRLSNLVDIILKPFLIHTNSYIKDNLDFLAKCSRKSKWDTILTTFEVVGPSKYHPWIWSLHQRFCMEFVLESVKFI